MSTLVIFPGMLVGSQPAAFLFFRVPYDKRGPAMNVNSSGGQAPDAGSAGGHCFSFKIDTDIDHKPAGFMPTFCCRKGDMAIY
jgi:hypothetical protein